MWNYGRLHSDGVVAKDILTLPEAIDICKSAEIASTQLKSMADIFKKQELRVHVIKKALESKQQECSQVIKQTDKKKSQCSYCGQTHRKGRNQCSAYGEKVPVMQ